MKTKTPTQLVLDFIDRNITYDPHTGILFKKGKKYGTIAKRGTSSYIQLNMFLDTMYEGCRLSYMVFGHQLAWYLAYKEWPSMFIDHIDGDGTNNKLTNLRLVTSAQNMSNQRKTKKKTSSQYKGVTRRKNSYRAYVTFQRKRFNLGSYHSEIEAAKAYNAKATELFGEYARLNVIPT